MPVIIDNQPLPLRFLPDATLGNILDAVRAFLGSGKRVIVQVDVDGEILSGELLTAGLPLPAARRNITLTTRLQTELAESMIGRLAALIEFLAGQHVAIGKLLETGQTAAALEKLSSVLSAWQQIQQAFAGTVRLLHIELDSLQVGPQTAAAAVNDFHRQLTDIANALKAGDMVLLGDILQYEMDCAIKNWTGVLESTLAVAQAA